MKQTILTKELPLWLSEFKSASKVRVISRVEVESELVRRSLKNKEFKAEMFANCKKTIEELYGVKLPSELSIHVLEESDSLFYLVLPNNPYKGVPEDELKGALGLTLKDVAEWVLENGRNIIVDKENTTKIILRAWEDEIFKQNLLRQPKETIESISGERLHSGILIELKEETSENIYIVLPACDEVSCFEEQFDQELSLDLAIGSGGFTQAATCGNTNFSCSCPF